MNKLSNKLYTHLDQRKYRGKDKRHTIAQVAFKNYNKNRGKTLKGSFVWCIEQYSNLCIVIAEQATTGEGDFTKCQRIAGYGIEHYG